MKKMIITVTLLAVLALVASGAYWLGTQQGAEQHAPGPASSNAEHKALYWYDPMVPQQQFDKPGKSPFMDMALVPKYAEEGNASGAVASVKIDPRVTQNLGIRTASVTRGSLTHNLQATGVLAFNERDVSIVQARAAGFVERVFARAG